MINQKLREIGRILDVTEKDIKDAIFAIEQEVDWIALSFVRTPEDLIKLSDLIKEKSKYHY